MSPQESFRNFAVRTYCSEDTSEACLILQNEYGADVNLLLFCCWMGITRGEVEVETFNEVMEFSHTWADRVVRPLRNVRSWMKTEGCPDPAIPLESCMKLRERIKKAELEAEQLQEDAMQSLVDTISAVTLRTAEQARAAAHNLRHYCDAEGIDSNPQVQAQLDVILRAAIPNGTDQ